MPRGQAPSAVDEKTARRLAKERALIEGSIGAIKSSRYNFNRPRARSVEMMGTCGQLAVLGFNINKGAARTGREAAAGLGRLTRQIVKGGDQVQVRVHVKADVNDYVDVNGLPNCQTRCS